MTAKDFELIAAALRHSRPNDPVVASQYLVMAQWRTTRTAIVEMIALTHPRFKHGRFIAATER